MIRLLRGVGGLLSCGTVCQTAVRIKLQVWLMHVWLSDLNVRLARLLTDTTFDRIFGFDPFAFPWGGDC